MSSESCNASIDYFMEAEKSILFTTKRPDVVMECGEGMYLWDTNGKKYLDFIGGWGATCLGHCPEAVKEALSLQAGALVNASPAFYNKPMIELAKLLTEISCFDKVFFASSGAEANEGAIKLARKYGVKLLDGASEIITVVNGFHGRTLATMSATGKRQWKALFEPKVPGFKHVPINDIDALIASIDSRTCAIMIEPIQGEGGVNPVTEEYMKCLREICDDYGTLLIFDEIQTGIGRTGRMFAYEHYGVEPDVMTLGKCIGGGFPLSAMLTKKNFDLFEQGDQGGTYCGQPLATAVGLAVINEIINKELVQNAEQQGKHIIECLSSIKDRYGLKNIRGKGLLIAFDLPKENAKQIVEESLKQGLILNSPQPATIRLIPALILDKQHVDQMMQILISALDKAS